VRFGHNETVLGRGVAGRLDQAVVATKFASSRKDGDGEIVINGRPEYVRACCDASLQRLGAERILVVGA